MVEQIKEYLLNSPKRQIAVGPRFHFDIETCKVDYSDKESVSIFDMLTINIHSLEYLQSIVDKAKVIVTFADMNNVIKEYNIPGMECSVSVRMACITDEIIASAIDKITPITTEEIKKYIRACENWQTTNSPEFLFNTDTKVVQKDDLEHGYIIPVMSHLRVIKSVYDIKQIIKESDVALVTYSNLDDALTLTPIILNNNYETTRHHVIRCAIIDKAFIEKKLIENDKFTNKGINNTLDDKYKDLVHDIMKNGNISGDRTGTGTKKVFGRMLRHNMSEGFPLLTTKKMFWKGVLHELIWFLTDCTNIKYLVDNGVYIWVGDCYKRYLKYVNETPDLESLRPLILGMDMDPSDQTETGIYHIRPLTQKEFIKQIKESQEFADEFGGLGKVYGSEWTNWEEHINQIQEVMDTLITNPDSRRMLVTAWNPTNVKKALLPSCHYAFQVVTRELSFEEKIKWVIRNTDVEMENLAITEKCYEDSTPKRAISVMFNI